MQKGKSAIYNQSFYNFTNVKTTILQNKSVFYISLSFVLAAALIVSLNSFNIGVYAQSPYNSGYSHGCSDAKISNPDNRYINQPEKGPEYHTSQFMSGYYDGFNNCYVSPSSSSSSDEGTFKVIVEVTNYSNRDTYGGITISVDHYPYNIFKSSYNIYFPAGETISKTFTFKSSDVPVGTGFVVNIDYGDDYNQYIYGENTPAKKPERVHFNIP
jgi:hypothetical protein